MGNKEIKETLKKQHYAVVGNHSAVQICRWTKKSLIDDRACYKEKFYGIKSHKCCQMSPWITCQNDCIHCWRPMKLNHGLKLNKIDSPTEIINQSIKAQRKLLTGFKGNSKINLEKFNQAQEPDQFAISLIGEPTLYSKLPELIKELRKQKKSSFIVTNGLYPEMLLKLEKEKSLPTQLYVSLNTPNKKMFIAWEKTLVKDAWKKFNQTLDLIKKFTKEKKTRTVIRMTMVREKNIDSKYLKEYSELIKKAQPDFVEIKGYMAVGYARERLGYETMPTHDEIKDFVKEFLKFLPEYKYLDEQIPSRVILIGKDRKRMKIKKAEI